MCDAFFCNRLQRNTPRTARTRPTPPWSRTFTGEIEFTKALETRFLFEPGFAADALSDFLWERQHRRAKRVRIIADAIVRTGWLTQRAYQGASADAPRLTEEVAVVLVN